MKIFFANDVDQVTTPIHVHGRAKPKKGETAARLVVECNDQDCIDAMKAYGGADNLRAVKPTFDELEQQETDRIEAQRLSAEMARELARGAASRVAAGG